MGRGGRARYREKFEVLARVGNVPGMQDFLPSGMLYERVGDGGLGQTGGRNRGREKGHSSSSLNKMARARQEVEREKAREKAREKRRRTVGADGRDTQVMCLESVGRESRGGSKRAESMRDAWVGE